MLHYNFYGAVSANSSLKKYTKRACNTDRAARTQKKTRITHSHYRCRHTPPAPILISTLLDLVTLTSDLSIRKRGDIGEPPRDADKFGGRVIFDLPLVIVRDAD